MLAKQVLESPIEIQVGGRSVVNSDISQSVEIRPEEDRFLRLLEILGEWYERGKILIFVSSQDQCDNLFRDLIKVRSLHGLPSLPCGSLLCFTCTEGVPFTPCTSGSNGGVLCIVRTGCRLGCCPF